MLVDPRTGDWQPDYGVALMPIAPLQVSTWYTVQVSGTINGAEASDFSDVPEMSFTRAWRFRTVDPPKPVVIAAPAPAPSAGTGIGIGIGGRPTAKKSVRRTQSIALKATRKQVTFKFGALQGRKARKATVLFQTAGGRRVKTVTITTSGTRCVRVPKTARRVRLAMPQSTEWKARMVGRTIPRR